MGRSWICWTFPRLGMDNPAFATLPVNQQESSKGDDMQLSPEESRKAIERIRKYGEFPPDKYFFSAVELEEFYGLPILMLWECMSKTDEWGLRIPPNTDCKIIYKRPFTKETGAYLIRCKDFERKLIKDVGLPAYAIEEHIKICHQGNCPVAVETTEDRIADLEGQLAALKAELEQARQENAVLQAELENTKAELEKVRQGEGQCLEWYGLIAVVEQSRKEGKTPQETAACLKERGASWAMIGGLMHPQGDIKGWQQYGKDLFNGKTKTLPW